ncbi:GntR family transcriptional regulator [Bradyrhizobium sp. Ash2021]|uniref:GntR family transcriptional regulator n=1 Tax=Bradyrhizobium sp. Ash2021 TaxID=2954771 RepID=UPI002815D07D|nr:GntR family transcriptional regulator [Bradyrhizobium sp. Ash2021]WMT76433.1 FCD domain-containing protein [Bradyrhizobium sp. Ash2021]
MLKTKKHKTKSKGGETLASSAYERLRFDIISGIYEPGTKLLIRELCSRYEIGLSPVREALNRVSRDGLVQQNDQRGFTVAPLSEEDLEDINKTRCWSNEAALRASIANGDQAWEERVLIAFHRMSRLPGPAERDSGPIDPAWEQAHRAFHTALIDACGSKWLIDFCEQLFDAADRYRFLSRKHYQGSPLRRDDHRLIMEATLQRNVDVAVRLLKEHFTVTLEYGRIEVRRLNAAQAKLTKAAKIRTRSSKAGGTSVSKPA